MVVLKGTRKIFDQMIRDMPEVDEELKKRLYEKWE